MKTIVGDPGHGGRDPGGGTAQGIVEKDMNLRLALATRNLVAERYDDVCFVLTRETDTALGSTLGTDLQTRVDVAVHRGADLFFSFHNNASENSKARGGEIYIYGPESWEAAVESDGTVHHEAPNSYRMAKLMEPIFVDVLTKYGIPYNGIKTGDFQVLRENPGPGILIEAFYATNPGDAEIARTAQFQADLADAYAGMIGAALELSPKQTWESPKVKVVIECGSEQVLWGELKDDRTMIQLPHSDLVVPLRTIADLMGRKVQWIQTPPTAIVR